MRRLQNFCRWAESHEAGNSDDPLHGIAFWNSILRAPGLAPGFTLWWPTRWYVCPADPVAVPQFCPASWVARCIYDAVFAEVRLFEQRLTQMRAMHRTTQHALDRNLIFREVARPQAEPVDTLLASGARRCQ